MTGTFKLHHDAISWNCLRPLMVLAEKGITDFEHVPGNCMTGAHRTPDYLAKAPFGQLPMLEDPSLGLTLYESRVISRYLCLKYRETAPSLIADSKDIKQAMSFEQALAIEAEEFNGPAERLIHIKIIDPFMGKPPILRERERNMEKLEKCLNILNDILSKQKFMWGNDFSLADIFYMPAIHMLVTYEVAEMFSKREHVEKWWKTVSARPSWKKVSGVLDAAYEAALNR